MGGTSPVRSANWGGTVSLLLALLWDRGEPRVYPDGITSIGPERPIAGSSRRMQAMLVSLPERARMGRLG